MLADQIMNVERVRCEKELAVNKIMDDWECITISIVRCLEAGRPLSVSHVYITEDTIKCLRYIGFRVGATTWQNYKFVPHQFFLLEIY